MHTERTRLTFEVAERCRRRQRVAIKILGSEVEWRRPHVAFRVIGHFRGKRHHVVHEGSKAFRITRCELVFELALGNKFEYVARCNELSLLIVEHAHCRTQFVRYGPLPKCVFKGQQHCQGKRDQGTTGKNASRFHIFGLKWAVWIRSLLLFFTWEY